MGLACFCCFLGGYGTSIFSQISIDLVNISRSRRDKFSYLAMATTSGHVLGPLLFAYLLIYQFLLSDPAKNNSIYKFMCTFLVQVFVLLFCFYKLLKIINEYQERTLDMIGSL
jgi:hypothetical protein